MNVPQNYVHFQVKIYTVFLFFFQESDLKLNGFCCFSLLKIPKDGGNLRGIHLMVYFKNSNLTLNSSSCPEWLVTPRSSPPSTLRLRHRPLHCRLRPDTIISITFYITWARAGSDAEAARVNDVNTLENWDPARWCSGLSKVNRFLDDRLVNN